jgi:hypothetical protein
MPATIQPELPAAPRAGLRLAAFEIVWIVLIFFLFAGSPPPDVGESHYLVKAKHYWQPTWCAGDLFLESRDAHATFNWVFGWATKFCSLTATAWIGRGLTWLLLAWSWRRLSWAIVSRPLVSLLSAGLMLLLLRNFHLAGEWVVGGVEAKGIAYVLVFLALEAIVRSRWRAALLLAGAAGAFHVLVGGWTAVAIGLAWLIQADDRERPRLVTLIPAAAGGLALALPGLIPALALNWSVPKDITREAARIYVFERLSHHLVYHRFPEIYIARFQALLVAWIALVWLLRREAGLRRLQWVVAGAVAIGAIGALLDQGMVLNSRLEQHAPAEYELRAARLLRYYWFRMSDSLVPVGVALAIVAGLHKLQASRPVVANWLTMAAILLAAANVADIYYWRSQQRLPGAILQPRPTADSWPRSWFQKDHPRAADSVSAREWYRDWLGLCTWIEANTPAEAKFLTPREQQTFKWYAGRAEVANWKDIPQDARGLVAWKQVLQEIYPRDREHHRHDLAAFSDAELLALARKHRASYIVIDRTRADRRIDLPHVYPLIREENTSFDVYRVPEQSPP